MDQNQNEPLQPKTLTSEQRALLNALHLDPDLVMGVILKRASKNKGDDEPDWTDITKRSLLEQQSKIMQQKHQTVTGRKTASVSKKNVGNKAILRELAELREDMARSLSSLHNHINRLEAALDAESRQRFIMWLAVMYLLESNQIELPKSTELIGWFASRLNDPHFRVMANNISEIAVHDVIANMDLVNLSKMSHDVRFMGNASQFKTFTEGFPIKKD